MIDQGGSRVADRVTYGFRLTVSRRPSQQELNKLVDFYRQQSFEYSKDMDSAYKTVGAKPKAVADGAELAAWTMVANVLLNTDEALSKE